MRDALSTLAHRLDQRQLLLIHGHAEAGAVVWPHFSVPALQEFGQGAKTLHHALEQAGIEHTFLETEGAHHWRVWPRYLRDLVPLLFK
jgi:S-formylglutathione hydrolase FrmB